MEPTVLLIERDRLIPLSLLEELPEQSNHPFRFESLERFELKERKATKGV